MRCSIVHCFERGTTMMHVARWHRYRTGRRLTRIVLIGGLNLAGIVFGCGGIFAAQSPHVTFVPLTQRVQAVVHTLTPIPLALPIGFPPADMQGPPKPTHHWVITGTANARGYNIVWAPRWPRADTSVIDIATTQSALRQLLTRNPPTGEEGTGLWTFVGEKLSHPQVAPWKVPYAPNHTQAWVVDPYPGTALGAKKVPGTTTAETLGKRKVFKVTPTAAGGLYWFMWYQRGWQVTFTPYPLYHNHRLSAQVQEISDQIAQLPRIPRGAGTFYEQIGSGGPDISWIHGTVEYGVANGGSVRAAIVLLHRLPVRLF